MFFGTSGRPMSVSLPIAVRTDSDPRRYRKVARKRRPIFLTKTGVLNNTRRGVIGAAAAYPQSPGIPSQGLSYWFDQSKLPEGAASYIDRILRGANPADVPVQRPTKYSLIINLKTAKALGLTVPPSMLDLADEVIE